MISINQKNLESKFILYFQKKSVKVRNMAAPLAALLLGMDLITVTRMIDFGMKIQSTFGFATWVGKMIYLIPTRSSSKREIQELKMKLFQARLTNAALAEGIVPLDDNFNSITETDF